MRSWHCRLLPVHAWLRRCCRVKDDATAAAAPSIPISKYTREKVRLVSAHLVGKFFLVLAIVALSFVFGN